MSVSGASRAQKSKDVDSRLSSRSANRQQRSPIAHSRGMNPEISRLYVKLDEELAQLSKLEQGIKRSKNEDIKYMISYMNDLTKEIEARRNSLKTSALQFTAVLLTLLGLVGASGISLGDWGLVIIPFLVTQLTLSLAIIVAYEIQSRFRYPFLKLDKYTNQWKWFYYGNEHILEISRREILPSHDIRKTHIPYLEGLLYFVNQYREEDIDTEIRSNILQLYLLQVHNYYKNRFYLRLVGIRTFANYLSIAFVVVAALLLFVQSVLV